MRLGAGVPLLKRIADDGVVQRARPGHGRHAQLFIQQTAQLVVTADSARAVTGQNVQSHRRALEVFLQRVEGQGARQRIERGGEIAPCLVLPGEGRESAHRQALIAFPLNGQPVVEDLRIGQGKASQKLAAVKRQRLGQHLGLGDRRQDARLEAPRVYHGVGREGERIVAGDERLAQRLAQPMQSRAEEF